MSKLSTILAAGLSMALAFAAHGQTQPPATGEPVQLVPLETLKNGSSKRNRFTVSYQMGLNIKADFKKLGGMAALSNPGPATGGIADRTYDNGYNLIDITGNNHGPGFENTTWNWGYSDASSVQGDTLVFSSSSSPGNAVSRDNSDDPQHGVEIGYGRELWQKGRWRFGLESGLGYTRLSISDSRTLTATVNRITDTFSTAGVVLPPAPYSGSFNGPGAVIGSEPLQRSSSVINSVENTIVGSRSLDSHVFNLRLGPYAELPLSDRFSLLFSGGLYLAVADTRFRFNETVTIPGTGSVSRSGSGSETDFLVGGYVGGSIEYALTQEVGLFVGAQFQSAGRTVSKTQGKEAIINLGESVVVSIGASYSF